MPHPIGDGKKETEASLTDGQTKSLPRRASRRQVGQLSSAEQLLLWSLRIWAAEGFASRMLQQEYFLRFGLIEVDAALQALDRVLETLARHGRRVPAIHCTACDRVGLDEEAVMALVAALQTGDRTYAAAAAPWLVEGGSRETLVTAAEELAQIMARHDLPLPASQPKGSPQDGNIRVRPAPRSGRPRGAGQAGA